MIHSMKQLISRTGLAVVAGCLGISTHVMGGALTLDGSLSATGNLSASSLTLSGQTMSNWPTGNLSGGVTTLSNSVLDFTRSGYYYRFTLTNDTTWVLTNHVPGRTIWLKIAQDTNGGWNNTWPANLLWPGGTSSSVPSSPNHFSVFKILDDGDDWLAHPDGLNYGLPCVSNCNYALQFDGTHNYVSVPALINTNTAKTVEFWAKSTGTGNGFYAGSWNDPYEWSIMNNVPAGQWYLQTAAGTVYVDPVPDAASDGQWHHYAFVEQSGTVTIYIDGTAQASGSASLSQTATFNIGAIADGYVPYTGLIDEFRISNKARYTNDFSASYCDSLHFTNDANTVGLWHFDEGIETSTADSSGHGYGGTLSGSPAPAWVAGANCDGGGEEMGMMMRSGGRGFGGSSMTTTGSPTSGSSMTITDTLGRIWGLIH